MPNLMYTLLYLLLPLLASSCKSRPALEHEKILAFNQTAGMEDEDLDTDTKLAILQSTFEHVDQEVLLEMLLSCEGSVERAVTRLTSQTTKRRRFEEVHVAGRQRLAWRDSADTPKRKVEAVLELHTAQQIEAILPCTLMTNVLPATLSRRLLQTMLTESENWTQGYFKLFDRTVTSPHVANFYVETQEDVMRHNQYVYNGQKIEAIRPFTQEMSEAHHIVEQRTRDWLHSRQTDPEQLDVTGWHANVAFSNLYDGRESAVGYHSDQLTYLGPLPTIASLSLGCEREFRLKPISSVVSARTISLRLPHNSLLVMGPGCQEDYKHSIHPVSAKKGLDLHPIAGARRINITYRNYRKEFSPDSLPHCKCGQAVLRLAKPVNSDSGKHNQVQNGTLWHGRRYFWHCDGDKKPGSEGCGYFKWAEFTANGAPLLA